MARCKSCGKVNRDGAHFCQDCGNAIDGPAGPAVGGAVGKDRGRPGERPAGGAAVAAVASAPASSGAGIGRVTAGDAAAGHNPGPRPATDDAVMGAAVLSASSPGRVSCSQCGQPTPSGFMFCQHCGHRITGEREAGARAVARPARVEVPSAELPPPVIARAAVQAASPGGNVVEAVKSASARPLGGTLRGRLIVMRRDGSDGESIALSGEVFDIGRSGGSKNFADDPFMAARHVRFLAAAGGVRVRPLDLVNGVYIQLREPYELLTGDVFYIGRELIRFEMLPPEERDPVPAVEHGVRVFGSTPRESWARLRQLTTAALVRDMWHLSRAEVLLGREEGDIVFPDDEFMSRRHALISRVGGRVRLEDQHSSNGTYVRLRGDRDVQPNDVLRVGDQVLRFEP